MATGLTLIFGVMDIINVAQGILVILGAYLSYALSAPAPAPSKSSGSVPPGSAGSAVRIATITQRA